MDDLDVIRFVAMDIITNPAYHAPSRNTTQFLVLDLLGNYPTAGCVGGG
jgi:hypothetical protein